jgi:hypothetical protein
MSRNIKQYTVKFIKYKPAGSKKDVFRFRSVNSIVIAPARTGNDSNNNSAVIPTAHTNSGIRSGFILLGFMLIVVEMKFTALYAFLYVKKKLVLEECDESYILSTHKKLCINASLKLL